MDAGRHAALTELAGRLRARGYRFTTVTPATHARVNARDGNEWARTVEDVFGWSRPFRGDLMPHDWLELLRAADALRPHGDGWRATVRASTLDELLYLHSAFPTTEPDAVFFGPDTYRFASAIVADLADGRAVTRAVDIGCGSGPGALTIARLRPDADVLALDINERALDIARINARAAHLAIDARRSDLLSAVDGTFDFVVANPPYLLDRDERTYRHGGGSFGEGLSLAIVDLASTRLSPGGTLLLYTGVAIHDGVDGFRAQVAERLAATDLSWSYREVDPDVFGEELAEPAYATTDRIAAVVLTATRPR